MKIAHFWNAQAFFQIEGEREVFDTKIISHTHLNQNKHNFCKLMFFIVLDLVRKLKLEYDILLFTIMQTTFYSADMNYLSRHYFSYKMGSWLVVNIIFQKI